MTASPQERIVDAADELTRPRTHREPYQRRTDAGTWVHDRHVTQVASLLNQLHTALTPGGTTDSGHAIPGSRPAARLEAIDTLLAIDVESAQWVDHLGLYLRGSLAGNLRALVGVSGTLEQDVLEQLAACFGRWLTWARVTTGWEVPTWKPDNTCPLCGERRSLRVRLGDGVTSSETHAMCVACREHWTPETIGLLADHIRLENGDELGEAS